MPHEHSPPRAAGQGRCPQRPRLGAASLAMAPELWASTARRRGAQAMARSHQLRVPTTMGLFDGPRLPFMPLPARGTAPPCKSDPALMAGSCPRLSPHLPPRSPPSPTAPDAAGLVQGHRAETRPSSEPQTRQHKHWVPSLGQEAARPKGTVEPGCWGQGGRGGRQGPQLQHPPHRLWGADELVPVPGMEGQALAQAIATGVDFWGPPGSN